MREHSAIRGILLVTIPLVILTSVALVTMRVGPASDPAPPRQGVPPAYTFSLLYAILHDDSHGPLPPEEIYARRLAHLETVIERESFGRIMISPELHFVHAREIGDDRLAYLKQFDLIPKRRHITGRFVT